LAPVPPPAPKPDHPVTAAEFLAFAALIGEASVGLHAALVCFFPLESPAARSGRPPTANWFGQDASWLPAHVAFVLVFIYAAKRLLCRVPPSRDLWLYLLVLVSSLPYIWFLVVVDWFNPYTPWLFCWIGYPILIWTVPTVSFLNDRLNSEVLSTGLYVFRSVLEVVSFFPIWSVIWVLLCAVLMALVHHF
jgi:hypothetical protein